MIIGAHVSAAGGVMQAIPRATELGVSAIQIFASAPGNWNPPKATLEDGIAFGKACRVANLNHIFFHSIYLINLASDNSELVKKSQQSLITALDLNAAMGGNGVIFHVGSSKDRSFDDVKNDVAHNISEILKQSDPESTLVIEINAGQGNCIGDTFEEIAYLIEKNPDPKRIGVCFDTAHAFASGYDLVNRSPQDIFDEFNAKVGLQYLRSIHCNDSKTDFSSRVDRHENIGQGKLGDKPFQNLLKYKPLEKIPFILEVPGYGGTGPDKKNVDHLKKLAIAK
jgi:deoxyribonuclease-4